MWTELGSAFIGGVAGFGVSLATPPWANWGVERARDSREHKRKLLESWRAGVAGWRTRVGNPSTIDKGFVHTRWYGTLRGHLSDKALAELEGTAIQLLVNSPLTFEVVTLQSEIDRIESEWGLRPAPRECWSVRRLIGR